MTEKILTDLEATAKLGTSESESDATYPAAGADGWGGDYARHTERLHSMGVLSNNLRIYEVDGTADAIGCHPGRCNIDGAVMGFSGADPAVSGLTDNDTTYVWIEDDGGGGAQIDSAVDGTGWPGTAHIKLAEVTLASGVITAILDRRGERLFRTGDNTLDTLTSTDSNFIVGNGSAWVAESAATARTSLGATASVWGVAVGGTGAVTLADTGVLIGNGTGVIQATAAGTDGQVLIGQTGADPEYRSISGDITTDSSGVTAIGSEKITKAMVAVEDSDGTYPVGIYEWRSEDGGLITTSSTTGDFNLSHGGAWDGGTVKIQGEVANSNTKTSTMNATWSVPHEVQFGSGNNASINVEARYTGAGTPSAVTVDVQAWRSDREGDLSGVDAITTSAQTLSASWATIEFILDGATAAENPNSPIHFAIRSVLEEVGGSDLNVEIGSVWLSCQRKVV